MPQLLEVNGVRINIEVRGNPSGRIRTLVLLHGFTGSAAGWGSHLDRFAENGLRVIALDLLGHGLSAAPPDPHRYRVEECCRDSLAVLTQLGVAEGEATLLGYSMGGRMALYTAFSGFFRALILESASPGLASVSERRERRRVDEALARRIECEGIQVFVSYWESLPLFASQRRLPRAEQALVHEQRLRNLPAGLANSLRGAGAGWAPALHRKLSELQLPVLLIAGALDSKYCVIAQEMSHRLPNAQVEIVGDAGHTVHLEQPEIFDRLVVKFCSTHA
ncbi:MAG: 2-succinyl-6-hydroxy-2,4-cyclohexadiene-1-carboxylate synthase [Ktedonobacterales bacterium]